MKIKYLLALKDLTGRMLTLQVTIYDKITNSKGT